MFFTVQVLQNPEDSSFTRIFLPLKTLVVMSWDVNKNPSLVEAYSKDHEESIAAVDQLDRNIKNASLEESDECDTINEGTAEGSDDDFNIKSDSENSDMEA